MEEIDRETDTVDHPRAQHSHLAQQQPVLQQGLKWQSGFVIAESCSSVRKPIQTGYHPDMSLALSPILAEAIP